MRRRSLFSLVRPLLAFAWLLPLLAAGAAPAAKSKVQSVAALPKTSLGLSGKVDYHVTGEPDSSAAGTISLNSPDAWLFLDRVPPSRVIATLLGRVRVGGAPADSNANVRVVQYGTGSV